MNCHNLGLDLKTSAILVVDDNQTNIDIIEATLDSAD